MATELAIGVRYKISFRTEQAIILHRSGGLKVGIWPYLQVWPAESCGYLPQDYITGTPFLIWDFNVCVLSQQKEK